jgi:WD40 repeat protein
MAQVQLHSRAIAAAILGLAALAFAPAFAEDQGPKNGRDLYDRPVLAIDPGMHTAEIDSQAVDAAGRFAVTGSDDRTVRVWSLADGKLLRTIWIPIGSENVGDVYAVAISPDGSTIAVGGYTERSTRGTVIYLFDRASGSFAKRIHDDLPNVTHFLTFSPDGRYLAATLGGPNGLRIFDRDEDWREAFRDDQYGESSYGAAFARDGRLATTALDGLIRLYEYNGNSEAPNFRHVGDPVKAPSGHLPYGVAFNPEGDLLAVGYADVAAADVLAARTLKPVVQHRPSDVEARTNGMTNVAWSRDGQALFSAGTVDDTRGRDILFAWDNRGQGHERRMTYCAPFAATDVNTLPGANPCRLPGKLPRAHGGQRPTDLDRRIAGPNFSGPD